MGWRDDGTLVGTKGKLSKSSLLLSRWPGGHIARRAAGPDLLHLPSLESLLMAAQAQGHQKQAP